MREPVSLQRKARRVLLCVRAPRARAPAQAHVPHLFDKQSARALARPREVGVPTGHSFVPAVATGGAMCGTVYTIPGSAWHDSATLFGLWPPAYTGKQAVAMKWAARLDGGHLVMRQDDKNELKCAVRSCCTVCSAVFVLLAMMLR
jgi:hypothetical protein